MPETLYLIDAHAFIFRAFYAMENLRSPDGRPVNAVFQFVRMLNSLRREFRPEYLIAVFDPASGPTLRRALYPEYKANRKPTPPELREQIPLIQEIVEKYDIETCVADGYEADDVIGTLAAQAEAAGMNVVVVSGDKDLAQLLTPKVTLFDPVKNARVTVLDYEAKNGFPPTRLPDLFGLWGDASDNIPGVAGIGEKIGRELIQKYGTLENLLDHAGEVKGKRGEVLAASREVALLSKDLATIRRDAPVTFDKARAAVRAPDVPALRLLYTGLGFGTLLAELEHLEAVAPAAAHDYQLIDAPDKFAAFLAALSRQPYFAIDTETTGLNPMTCELVGVSFSWAPSTAFYLPFRAPAGEPFLGQAELDKLRPILENPAVHKCAQNYKFDSLVLFRNGIHVQGWFFDTMLASSLLTAHLRGHDLDTLALRYLGIKKIPTADVIGSGAKETTMDAVPVAKVAEYSGEDADVTWRLSQLLADKMDGDDRRNLEEIEIPLSHVLAAMQYRGIRVLPEALAAQSQELATVIAALTAEIYGLAGQEFNIASPRQLGEILFDKLGMPSLRRTKTGHSTDEGVLQELAGMGHELPLRVLEYRQYVKLKNTYLDALPQLINPATGRIHTTFSQTATATGRLASSNPNLQNIPVRTEKGRAIRAAFVPADGWRMLSADYSQVELRVMAHFAGDKALRRAFAEGRDVHRVVAAAINHVPEDAVTPEQRRAAKAVNFGIIYGQTAHGLAQTTGMGRQQAQDFIDRYFLDFPMVRAFIDATLDQAMADGYVRTMLGRRREIPELHSSKRPDVERGRREAINTVIQGSAAEIIKLAMLRLSRRLRDEKMQAQMLLQIHDELVLEAPAEEMDALAAMVREEMEGAVELAVPLKVDVGVGDDWLSVK
ncbi:MAG: DNA polymerase I [Planctomycetes bacterium]|nr:DNA polymerase I [Planctomycetota bacterium]